MEVHVFRRLVFRNPNRMTNCVIKTAAYGRYIEEKIEKTFDNKKALFELFSPIYLGTYFGRFHLLYFGIHKIFDFFLF